MSKRRLFTAIASFAATLSLAGVVWAQGVLDSLPATSIPAPKSVSTKASGEVFEGYARTDYLELIQTIVVLGGLDINNERVADQYARLTECAQYTKYYRDDFSWNNIRQQVVDRVRSKRENFRTLYEYRAVVELDRYDFTRKVFPFTRNTSFNNVGRMDVMLPGDVLNYLCRPPGDEKTDVFFPLTVGFILSSPLNLTGLAIPPEKAENVLTLLRDAGGDRRSIYVRFRFKVVDQPRIVIDSKQTMQRADLSGYVEYIDFFLDRDLTMWIASMPAR